MDLTNKTIGKYKLTERLGSGGMAEVYKAFQSGVERDVAIKVMHSHLADSADFRERFQREAKAIGQLQHPNIVHVIDFDAADGNFYMVMDYLPGGTLRDYLTELGDLPLPESLSIMSQLCDALSYAHQRDMIHRDIKPANIMFSNTARSHVILTDFGMARLKNESKLTVSGELLGTPAYMPPEVVKGEPADHRADLYSLGAVFYEMVTGRTPHVADTPYGVLIKQANEPLPMPSEFKPDIDPALEAFLLKALAKDPADRFADAQEMLAEIQIFQGTESTTMTRLSNPSQATQISTPPNQKSGKNNKWFILAGTLIGVVVIALLAMVLLNQQPVEEIAVVTPAVTPTNAAVLVIATETAVPEPTSIPAILEAETITAVPTLEPTAEPVETPPPVDIAQQSFSVDAIDFSGPAGQPANTFSLSLARIQLPDTGTEHVVWLIKDGTPQRLGTLPVGSPPDLSAAIEGSDVTEFERFVISMEPIGNSAEITGTIVYEKTLSDEFLAPLTTLLNENLVNANTQLAIAQDHTGFLQNELANGNLENALVHAEHVVNILDGANGTDYGDLNGDGMAQNPGDDIGVRAYLESATASAAQALEAAALSGFAQSSAEKMVRALENSSANQKKAQALALKLFALDSVAEIQPFADELEILLQQVQAGSDNDGNGVVDALAGEGGLTAVYDNGLSWLAHSYVAENGTNSAENSPAGTLFFAPDGLTLTLNDVLLPPVGTAYHAWLLNETTSEITPLGPLSVINNHIRATFPVTQPVTTPNSQLLITLENETEADAPTETAVYSGSLPPETNAALTGLLTPETGLLANLTVQTGLAIDHIGFMSEALAVGNLEDGKRHAEHVINILVGESSPEFGDLDNNGRAENPGNGVGVRIYLQQAAEQLALINLDSAERQFYAALTTAALDNSQIVIDDLLNKAGKIIAADSAAEASITMAEMMPLAEVLRSGLDKDENGVMDPLMGESGIQSLPDLLTAVGHWAITPQ